MQMTGPQLRLMASGLARVQAAAQARSMVAIRAAVWADRTGFEEAMHALEAGGARDDPSDWLMGYEGEA